MKTIFLITGFILVLILDSCPGLYASSDTLRIESRMAAPGYDYSFPIYGALHQEYSGFEIPLTFTSYDLVFDSASLDNSIVPDNYIITLWPGEDSSSAVIFIFPYPPTNFDNLIMPSGGQICDVYFHVRWFAPDQVVFVDTAAYELYDSETDTIIKSYTLPGYDENGSELEPEFVYGTIAISTGVDDNDQEGFVPDNFELFQNYPNPFNPGTRIGYMLPYETDVLLEIYNLLGQRVMRFERARQNSGYHEIEIDASSLKSGFYFYRIRAGDFTSTKKMLLLK
jgi:hypothetical protein